MPLFFQSPNVNDILSVCQKTTIYNKVFRNSHNQSWHQQAWQPFYQNDPSNPDLFMSEVDTTLPGGYATLTWPADVAAGDNPFGIDCVENDLVFTPAELALVIETSDLDGWTENDGIGV